MFNFSFGFLNSGMGCYWDRKGIWYGVNVLKIFTKAFFYPIIPFKIYVYVDDQVHMLFLFIFSLFL